MGDAKWVFRIQFSSDFQTMVGGERKGYGAAPEEGAMEPLLATKRFGVDLIYARFEDHPDDEPGDCYVQDNTVGFASIHFDPDRPVTDAYLSYEHSECDNFPPLDDGSKVPVRKEFKHVSFDPVQRRFLGTIDWSPTTWMGAVRWEYDFQLSADHSHIESGERKAFKFNARHRCRIMQTRMFATDLIYERASKSQIEESKKFFQREKVNAMESTENATGSTLEVKTGDGIAKTNTIAFVIDGTRFVARILAMREVGGKIQTNTQIGYIGRSGREWVHLDDQRRLLTDEFGHKGVAYKYVADEYSPETSTFPDIESTGTKRPRTPPRPRPSSKYDRSNDSKSRRVFGSIGLEM